MATNKMNKMFQDITVSKDFAKNFDEHNLRSETAIELSSAQILSSGTWPIISAQNCKIAYPIRLQTLSDQLQEYYKGRNNSKTITILN